MGENRKRSISLSTLLLIFSIIIIIAMGYIIYNLAKSKFNAEDEVKALRAETQEVKSTLSNLQNNLGGSTTNNNSQADTYNTLNQTTTEEPVSNPKTEKEQVEEIAKIFARAVNDKDWATLEKYSTSYVISDLKTYNVYNMDIDTSLLEKNPNDKNGYYCLSSYNIDYNGMDLKDLSLGCLMCIDKIDGAYKVTSFCATGL